MRILGIGDLSLGILGDFKYMNGSHPKPISDCNFIIYMYLYLLSKLKQIIFVLCFYQLKFEENKKSQICHGALLACALKVGAAN